MNLKNDKDKLSVVLMDKQHISQSDIAKVTGIPRSTIKDFLGKKSHVSWWDALEKGDVAVEETGFCPKLVVIDIETSLMEGYFWQPGENYITIDQIIKDWEILCFTAKELGQDVVLNVDARGGYCKGFKAHTDIAVAEKLWELLDYADFIIAHNGKRFDNKKIRAKLKDLGFPPPSPYKVIDTLSIARREFNFSSNKLDFLSQHFGFGGKQDTGGIQLWIDCMNGDEEAWETMIQYCENDVCILEEIYLELRPWDSYHPNLAVYSEDDEMRCGTCFSTHLALEEGKKATTNTSAFSVYRCQDCGAVKRDKHNTRSKEAMRNTLMNVRG